MKGFGRAHVCIWAGGAGQGYRVLLWGCPPNPNTPVTPAECHPESEAGLWRVPGVGCGGLRALGRFWGLRRACLHPELFLN